MLRHSGTPESNRTPSQVPALNVTKRNIVQMVRTLYIEVQYRSSRYTVLWRIPIESMWTNNGPPTPQLSVNSFNSGRTQFCGLSTFVNAYAICVGTQFTSKMYAIKSHITRLLSMIHSCSSSRRACHFFFLLSLSPKTSLFVSKPSSLNVHRVQRTVQPPDRINMTWTRGYIWQSTASFTATFYRIRYVRISEKIELITKDNARGALKWARGKSL